MIRLQADWAVLEQEFGCSLRDRFLMPVRSFDNARSVAPFLAEAGGRRRAFFLHVEKGNAEAAMLPPSIERAFYRPYFSFDPSEQPPGVHADLASALRDFAGGDDRISLDPAVTVAVRRSLEPAFRVEAQAAFQDAGTVTLRTVPTASVASSLARWRPQAAKAAAKLLERSVHGPALRPYLEAFDDPRQARLDAVMAAAGLDAVIVTSVLNLQEVAGVPMRAPVRPLLAVARPGEPVAVLERGAVPGGRVFGSPAAALASLLPAGARVGLEEDDMGVGLEAVLGLPDAVAPVAADLLLRRWRDLGTLPDLAFYAIATRVSRAAIDAALAHAERCVAAGDPITEMDAYAVYHATLHLAAAEALPELRVGRTLTNFHSGRRTIFPANAAPFRLTPESGSLKIDAGCLLFDPDGYLLGCSDIARTLLFGEPGRALYEVFSAGVRETLVPACRAGTTGQAVHAAACATVWGRESLARQDPLFRPLADPVAGYRRDVGHLLGKNNLAHLTFTSAERGVLEEGMVACCEYQWPVPGHAVAFEDTCLVTPQGGLNLTSDE